MIAIMFVLTAAPAHAQVNWAAIISFFANSGNAISNLVDGINHAGTGAWSFTPGGLTDGVHTLTASDTDVAGNIGTATLRFTLNSAPPAFAVPDYHRIVIDAHPIGHDTVEKALVDIQGTGKLAVVIGDGLGGGLWWYEQPASGTLTDTWFKHKISSGSFYEGIVSYDVNGDGAVDLIASDSGHRRVVWFENPRGQGGDPAASTWNMHVIRGGSAHDIRLGDLDGNGKIDVVTSSSGPNGTISGISFQNTPTSWSSVSMPKIGAGVALLDIGSGRGAINLVGADGNNIAWWENPREHGGNARTDPWIEHIITSMPGASGNSFTTGVFSSSGRMDILTASNEDNSDKGIYRLVAPADRRNGTWTVQQIASYESVHNIATGDMNNDGNLDFVATEEEQAPDKRVGVFYNDGSGNFTQQVLKTTGGQNQQVGDIDGDGDLDILNENHGYFGAPNPVELYINQLNLE